MLFAFIIPFKPKSQSLNWQKDCALLEATVNSILSQTAENFKIYIVCYDQPTLHPAIKAEKINFIQYDSPFIPFESTPAALESEYRTAKDKIIVARRWDKSKKIFIGCKKAKEEGCKYIMVVDADDLISNKLLAYIDKRLEKEEVPGFYISKGYLYRPPCRRMIAVNKNMQGFNGSTHVLRSDFVKIAGFESLDYTNFNLFTSHGWIISRMKQEYGIDLESIPFPALMYVAHGGNISNISNLNMMEGLKYLAKLIVRGKWLDKNIKREFGVR